MIKEFELTRPLSNTTLETMKLQSSSLRAATLHALVDGTASYSELFKRTTELFPKEKTSLNSFSHFCGDLVNGNLVDKSDMGWYSLSEVGRRSVEAVVNFRLTIIPELFAAYKNQLREEGGEKFADEVATPEKLQYLKETLSDKKHISPKAVLELMRIQSRPALLRILMVLGGENPHWGISQLKSYISTDRKELKNSTLSNHLKELESGFLLKRTYKGRAGWLELTSYGTASLQAINEYQNTLSYTDEDYAERLFEKTFGISLPGTN